MEMEERAILSAFPRRISTMSDPMGIKMATMAIVTILYHHQAGSLLHRGLGALPAALHPLYQILTDLMVVVSDKHLPGIPNLHLTILHTLDTHRHQVGLKINVGAVILTEEVTEGSVTNIKMLSSLILFIRCYSALSDSAVHALYDMSVYCVNYQNQNQNHEI